MRVVQFEGREHSFPDDATDAEIAAALEQVSGSPAAPESEIPVSDPVRGGAIQAANADAQGDNYMSPERKRFADIANQARELEAQRDDLHRAPGLAPVEKSRQLRALNGQINALRRQLPTDWAEAGSIAGGIAGGLGGAALGTVGAPGIGTALGGAAGATGGAFVGRMLGALYSVENSSMTKAEKMAYLDEKLGVKQVVVDGALNLLFLGTSGVIGSVAKNSGPGRRIINALGIDLAKVQPNAAAVGQQVFKKTTPEALQNAADDAALVTAQGEKVLPPSAITGHAGVFESRAHQVDPQTFKRSREAVEQKIEKDMAAWRDEVAGVQTGESPGHTLDRALTGLDAKAKAYVGPVYDRLRAIGSEPLVDISAIRAEAQAIVNKAAPGTLRGEQKQLLDDIVANADRISPEAAHELQSAWLARSRDLAKSGQPDEVAQRMFGEYGAKMRGALQSSLDDAASTVERQSTMFGEQGQKSMLPDAPKIDPTLPADLRKAAGIYSDMNKGVYSTTGSRALKAADSRGAEHVGATIYAKGNTTAIKELHDMEALAKRFDELPLTAEARIELGKRAEKMGFDTSRPLADQVAEARRGMLADFLQETIPNVAALRNLPEWAKKKTNQRLLDAAIPESDVIGRTTLERLSQMAQQAGRVGESTGSVQSTAIAIGAPGALLAVMFNLPTAAVGVAALYLGPKFLAHALTSPTYKALLSRNTAWLLRATQGGAGSTITKVPSFVQELVDKAKADGFDITQPEK